MHLFNWYGLALCGIALGNPSAVPHFSGQLTTSCIDIVAPGLAHGRDAVSYTHLTLPTIYSV